MSGQSDRDFALLEINHGLTEHSQDLILSYAKGIRDLEILMGHHEKRG